MKFRIAKIVFSFLTYHVNASSMNISTVFKQIMQDVNLILNNGKADDRWFAIIINNALYLAIISVNIMILEVLLLHLGQSIQSRDWRFIANIHYMTMDAPRVIHASSIWSCKCECFITVTSWIAWWRLKSPVSRLFTQPFIQAQI